MHVRIHFFCPEQLFFMCTVFLIIVNLSIIIKEEHSLACYVNSNNRNVTFTVFPDFLKSTSTVASVGAL